MSFQHPTPAELSCADFEEAFDLYVDALLEAPMADACSRHLSKCPACDREVTRWQQTRVLLSTAVADFATAVDVSALRRDVEAALGLATGTAEVRRAVVDREASADRGPATRRGRGRGAAREGRRAFSAVWSFASAATASASVAAAAVLLLTPAPTSSPLVGNERPGVVAPLARRVASGMFGSRSWQDVGSPIAPVAYSHYAPPPRARPEVSKVDNLEPAPGRRASTWVQRGTNASVIWVEDNGSGVPLRTGLER